jgi:hypothetical protein
MNPLAIALLLGHWEAERLRALAMAHDRTRAGRPALQYLRFSSRCEARRDKLVRLVERASVPRCAA